MKFNLIYMGIFFVGLILFVIGAIVYASTFGCMNNTHGAVIIDKITPYIEGDSVFATVEYHTKYAVSGSTCAYPTYVGTEFILDGIQAPIYSVSCPSPSNLQNQYCTNKILIGYLSSSLSSHHSLKICSNFDFTNHFFRSSNPSNSGSYGGLNWNGYSERSCSDEANFTSDLN